MIETKTYQPPISVMVRGLSSDRLELSRLLAAAVVSPKFCGHLIEEPEQAIKNGFQGETFLFTDEERDLVMSIRADSLSGLAQQLARTFTESIPLKHPVQLASSLGY